MRLRPPRDAGPLPGVRGGGYDAAVPMRRKLFTLCSAVSLLLCAAVCVLWVRSYGGDGLARVATVPDPTLSGLEAERDDRIVSRGGRVRWSRSWRPIGLTGNIEVAERQFPLLNLGPPREPSFAWEWQ